MDNERLKQINVLKNEFKNEVEMSQKKFDEM